jgi:hypothetical protein
MQEGAPPYSALPVCTRLENIFLVSGMSIKDQHNGLHKVLILPCVISFRGVGPKKSTDQNQEHLRNWNNKFKTLSAVPLDFLRLKC